MGLLHFLYATVPSLLRENWQCKGELGSVIGPFRAAGRSRKSWYQFDTVFRLRRGTFQRRKVPKVLQGEHPLEPLKFTGEHNKREVPSFGTKSSKHESFAPLTRYIFRI